MRKVLIKSSGEILEIKNMIFTISVESNDTYFPIKYILSNGVRYEDNEIIKDDNDIRDYKINIILNGNAR